MLLLLMVGLAQAESAWVMGAGERVVYGGVGISTFNTGLSGGARDRQYRVRLDTYGALGLRDGLQLAVDAPLVHTGILVEEQGVPPCPSSSDYCDPVNTVGELGVHLRARAFDTGSWRLAGDIGVRSDQWNGPTRGRWINAGQGTTSLVASAVFDRSLGPMTLTGWWRYGLVAGRPVEKDGVVMGRFPSDWTGGGLHLGGPLGPLWGTVTVSGLSRLGGVDYEPGWTDGYDQQDMWSILRYREIQVRAKLSVPIGESAGLHLSAGRVVWQDNGVDGIVDFSVGMHRSF